MLEYVQVFDEYTLIVMKDKRTQTDESANL
jgi:hypothetical protein